MAHRYTVANARHTEGERDPASLDYSLSDLIDKLVEVYVTGYDIVL
jgi:hypothetical protein